MDEATRLLAQPLVFFGGKGGVGKTTLAAAFALQAATKGNRTLLVSTDPAHSTSDILKVDLGPEPRLVSTGCWALEIDPQEETEQYIKDVKARIFDTTAPRLVDEVEKQLDIARVSPGAEEAAVFERFTKIIEGVAGTYDRIVFDTAPTAQTLRLLSLPEIMSAWIGGLISSRKKVNALSRMWRAVAGAAAGDGPIGVDPVLQVLEERRQRFNRTRQLLTDCEQTAFVFVVVPEKLPVVETERAVVTLDRYGIPVGALFVNCVLPADVLGEFWSRRREREAECMERIRLGSSTHPIYLVQLQDNDVVGIDSLQQLSASRLELANGG